MDIRLLVLLSLISAVTGSCLIGIAVDNEFTAYLNGKTIASSNSYSVLNTYEVDSDEVTSSVALIIDAHNTNGLSGILVASNDGIFSSNNGWFCANKEVFDGSDSWKDNEMSASGAQNWFQATVVASFTSGIWNKNDYNKVPSIQVENADWIWNQNPGVNGGTDGDRDVICRTTVNPSQCDIPQSGVITDPPNTVTDDSVITIDDRSKLHQTDLCMLGVLFDFNSKTYCLRLGTKKMNYETAQMTAVIHGQLVYIPNQIFQDNVQTLLDAYGMQNENIWTAAQMIDPLYVPKWQWVDPVGVTGLDPAAVNLNLAHQGCFQYSTYQNEFTRVTQNIVGIVTTATCIQECANSETTYKYAALMFDSECHCGNEFFGTVGNTIGCTSPCSKAQDEYCGGENKLAIYDVTGQWSDWDRNQPNNYEDYQDCVVFDSEGDRGQLKDEGCGSKYRYICEIPNVDSFCPSYTEYNEHTYEDARLRCFYASTTAYSWYFARQQCKALGGNLLVILSDALNQNILAWLDGIQPKSYYWVGAYRPIFSWKIEGSSNSPISEYDNFADGQPPSVLNWNCIYISGEEGYKWKSGGCDAIYHYVTIEAWATETTTNQPVITTTQKVPPSTPKEPPSTPTVTPSLPDSSSTATGTPTTQKPDLSTIISTQEINADLSSTSSTSSVLVTSESTSKIGDRATTQSIVVETTPKPTVKVDTTSTTTAGTTAAPQAPATQGQGIPDTGASTSSGLSTLTIVLIVLVVLVVLLVILFFIIFCCCCYKRDKKTTVAVGPRKYDARPIAPVPMTHKLGDEESGVYIVESDIGSTTNLVADPKNFVGTDRTPRYDWGY